MHLLSSHNSPVVSREPWVHPFGSALIEICADGTVLIDGKVVWSTLPPEIRAVREAEEAALLANRPPPQGVLR